MKLKIGVIIVLIALAVMAYAQVPSQAPTSNRKVLPLNMDMINQVLQAKDALINDRMLALVQANATIDDLTKKLEELESRPCTEQPTKSPNPRP